MTAPRPDFSVRGARSVEFAVAPTLAFDLEVNEPTRREIHTIALSCQVNIDPARRDYDPETRERLRELFGEPGRWAQTTRSFRWLDTSVLVPSFSGSTTFELSVLCNFDLELAATKYFYSLPDAEIPLTFLFSGTILYRGENDELLAAPVPWEQHAPFRLPVAVWKEMVGHYYPQSGWIRLHRETLEALSRYKTRRCATSFDACVSELLARADADEASGHAAGSGPVASATTEPRI